jgi:hypothetical protein
MLIPRISAISTLAVLMISAFSVRLPMAESLEPREKQIQAELVQPQKPEVAPPRQPRDGFPEQPPRDTPPANGPGSRENPRASDAGKPTPPDTSTRGSAVPAPATELIPVPSVKGDSQGEAEQAIEGARLTPRLGNTVQTTSATVFRQSPPPGTMVNPGTAVEIWFEAAPPAKETVPAIIGETQAQAQQVVARTHLMLQPGNTAQTADATVIRQSPAPGTMVDPGTAVEAWFEAAPPTQVIVPTIIGDTQARAEQVVASAHLALQSDDTTQTAPATVTRQSPAPGTKVNSGTAVMAWFEAAPSLPVITPNVNPGTGIRAWFEALSPIWKTAAGFGGLAALILAILAMTRPWRHRWCVTSRIDPGVQWISSAGDPVGPVLGLRVSHGTPVVELSWAKPKEKSDA